MNQDSRQEAIATSSVGEGLDFACNLLSSAIVREGESNPEKAQKLLSELAQYIQLRYVGEPLLALEHLASLGNLCNQSSFQSKQFRSQLRWIAEKMDLSVQEKESLNIPSE